MQTDLRRKKTIAVAAFLVFTSVIAWSQSMSDNFVNAADVPKSKAYSHGVVLQGTTDRRIMTSGIIGTDKSGALVEVNPRAQVHQAFENIRAILATVGAGVDDIIEIETFLVDTANFLDYALERRDFFKGRTVAPPISKTYYAKALINPRAIVELAVTAQIPAKSENAGGLFVTAVVRAKPGKSDALHRVLVENIAPTRKEKGCISYLLFQSQDDPHLFTLHEEWTNREALNQHFEQPYMKNLKLRGPELIESSQIIVVKKIGN